MKLWMILCFIPGLSDEHGCPSDGKTVGAVVGSNFTFTCFPPFGANDVLDASKDGGNEIFHYRKNKLTIQDEAYKDRIVKEPSEDKKKGFIIKLINVTKQDGGWYCCHYEYEGKRQKWINFTLDVKEKPSNLAATKDPSTRNSSSTDKIISGGGLGVLEIVVAAVAAVAAVAVVVGFLCRKYIKPKKRTPELQEDTPTQATGTSDEQTTEQQQKLEENQPLMDGSQESSTRLRGTERHLSRSCHNLNQDPSQRSNTLKIKAATYPPSTERRSLKKAA